LLIALKGRGGACLRGKEGEGECLTLDVLRKCWEGDGEATLTTVDMHDWLTFN
jgi:hypothetical protein